MTHDEILSQFRHQAAEMGQDVPAQNDLILKLAQLLAESRGKLSKENFETLSYIGAALYKVGLDHFNARQNVGDIMQRSVDERGQH